MAFVPIILASAFLFIVIFNIITIIAITRKTIAPSYFKVKLSLAVNGIMCLGLGYAWLGLGYIRTYDLAWLIIFLALATWYAIILANRPPNNSTRNTN